MSVMFDQRQQQVEGFGRKRHTLALAQKQTLHGIQPERAEFI
jgi:hypothetical protein